MVQGLSKSSYVQDDDWRVQTAKWVTRSDGAPDHVSPFASVRELQDRAAGFNGEEEPTCEDTKTSEAGTEEKFSAGLERAHKTLAKNTEAYDPLISALQYAKCSVMHNVNQGTTIQFAAALLGHGDPDILVTANGEPLKSENIGQLDLIGMDTIQVTYKQLKISIIDGPDGNPEMSVLFHGSVEQASVAEEQLEEFIERLRSTPSAVKKTGERRFLQLGDSVIIGLPNEGVFTQGVRFKLLETAAENEPKLVLDSDCMDAINDVSENWPTVHGIQSEAHPTTNQESFNENIRSKCQAYRVYREALCNSSPAF
jgi:hypothetical protein